MKKWKEPIKWNICSISIQISLELGGNTSYHFPFAEHGL